MADTSWHNLKGLKDGFLQMLADTSFKGIYDNAHSFGDLADDFIGLGYWDISYQIDW